MEAVSAATLSKNTLKPYNENHCHFNSIQKDLKLARKRGFPEDKLNEVILMLANDKSLPATNKDHSLVGNMEGIRECHILPDWLLLYNKEDGELQILNLFRTGTHSDLFK